MPRLTTTVAIGDRTVAIGEATLGGLEALARRGRPAGLPDWEARTREAFELCAVDCAWEELRELAAGAYPSELEALWKAVEEINAPFVASWPEFGATLSAMSIALPLWLTRPADSSPPATPTPGTTEAA